MVWNSANPTEYPNVREFAKKKKLALMSAHDSIIAARVKQTRDANRKRQIVPFKKGDFVYLSTKNITFEKGLARKLIPKFIGPYRIIQDFNNQSFQLELPTHLKRRGVHNVFHSSLLRIHIPNDDRLFPGRMDTQIGDGPGTEDEWAVDKVRTHAGSGKDSIFEIIWKSGDITWMPYYQIGHLQALETYLELLGADNISKLITGKGKPPQEDPQVFLGALSIKSPLPAPFQDSLPTTQIPSPTNSLTFPLTTHFLDLNDLFCSLESLQLLTQIYPFIDMPEGINHPCFTRINNTEYAFVERDSSDNPHRAIIHVGQIAKYLDFDRTLRDGRKIYSKSERPYGYENFALLFNNGVRHNDKRRMTIFTEVESGPFLITMPDRPVTLRDFKIRPEHCGLVDPRSQETPATQAALMELAFSAAADKKRKREAFEEREGRRQTKLRYFDEDPHQSSSQTPGQWLEEEYLPFSIDPPHTPSNLNKRSDPQHTASSSTPTNLREPSTPQPNVIDAINAGKAPKLSIVIQKETQPQPQASVSEVNAELDELLQPPEPMEL
jgi:hypothetical protein